MKNNILIYGFAACITTFTSTTFAADIPQGKSKSASCAGCHGSNGISSSQEFPNLAGQKQDYLLKQLKAFKSGARVNPTMSAMTAGLNKADMRNLSAYYSSLSQKMVVAPIHKTLATDKASKKEFPETVYISMKKSATVENFPQQVSWKGGPNMLYDAVTPDGKMVLSTSPSSNTVYVFNAKSGKQLAIIKVGKAPKGVKVTPDGKFAYVVNQGSSDVSIVDLKNLVVVDTIKVKKAPHNARFTKDGKLAYVTLQGGAGLAVIDTKARKMIKVIPIPGITGPHNIDLSSNEKVAFVRDFVHHVAVLDLLTGKVKKVITVGNGHGGIDVSPDGRFVVTGAIAADFVSIIDPKTFMLVKNIKVGNGPHGVRASKDSQWIYVTVTKDNMVVVINAKTMKVEKKIASGKFPFWVAVNGNP